MSYIIFTDTSQIKMQTVVPGDVFCIIDNTMWMIPNKVLNKVIEECDEGIASHPFIFQ